MDLGGYKIRPSKHFIASWMRKWNYDTNSIKENIENAYKILKAGKNNKYEAYFKTKFGSRKIIFIKDEEYKEVFIITGAEGK